MTNGRQKGNVAEREIAKKFQNWWEQIEPGVKFCRTPGSGGFGTPVIREDFSLSGDIMTNSKKFPFSVEVKRRENWAIKSIINGGKSPVWKWWIQTIRAANEMKKDPLLIFRKNCTTRKKGVGLLSSEWFIMLPADYNKIIKVPIRKWLPEEFKPGVDYGGVLPVLYFDYQLFTNNPSLFIK